jgi:hypothetical protein
MLSLISLSGREMRESIQICGDVSGAEAFSAP